MGREEKKGNYEGNELKSKFVKSCNENCHDTQEFKTLGIDDYLWVQALFNHEELERLRGVEPTNPHQRFLWRIIRMGVINPEAGEKVMDASTCSMRHSSAIGMRLWKMWREAES